jgi:hypothetical protein
VVATITYQSLFRLFYKLSGMTGTAMTDYKVRQHRSIFFDPFEASEAKSFRLFATLTDRHVALALCWCGS